MIWTIKRLGAIIAWAAIVALPGMAPSRSEASTANWEQRLEQAGASAAEIAQLRERSLSPAVQGRLEKASLGDLERLLATLRRNQGTDAPPAIYPGIVPVGSSDELRHLPVPNTMVESIATDPLDGSLRIAAVVTNPPAHDRVRVFVALPAKNWNGRFMGTGGGGYSGGSVGNLRNPVATGYAAAATDAGHPGAEATFALDASGHLDWQAIRDDAYLGIHEMTVVGKTLAAAYYGQAPRYSYFIGGSTAGREALMEAQRYPRDYDGIVALYPGIDRPSLLMAELWPQVVMREAGDPLPKAKLDAATAAAIAACAGAEGWIDDPSQCRYDPHQLVGAKVGDSVFTARDADVVLKIWAGPHRRSGETLWYGPARGADLSVMAGGARHSAVDWIRYFLLQQPSWDAATLDANRFELLWTQSIEQYEAVYGTDDANLAAFRARGGKLILFHGLADEISPAQATVDYYEKMAGLMGGAGPTAQFARLFLVPGQGHGFNQAVPAPVRIANAIVDWVEKDRAPDGFATELRDSAGKLIRQGQLKPFPCPPAAAPIDIESIASFHLGGRRVTLAGLPRDADAGKRDANGDYQVGQLYVQEFKLTHPKFRYPLLLWHGGGLTGVTWETTPDGRPGWRDFFLRSGYDTFVSDASERGRASWPPYPEIEKGSPWHRTENQAWSSFRIGPASGYDSDPGKRRAFPDTQFPIAAMDQFAKQFVPRWTTHDSDRRAEEAYGDLVDRVGACVIVAHSQGCQYALDVELAHASQIKAVIMIEPALAPEQARADLGAVKGIPVLIVWGDHFADSPPFQHWRSVATQYRKSLAALGGRIEVLDLPARGIRGNSHLLMMDRNSDQVAQLVEDWIQRQGLENGQIE